MAADPSSNLTGVVDAHGESASPDVLTMLVKTFADALMSAEAEALCGADCDAVLVVNAVSPDQGSRLCPLWCELADGMCGQDGRAPW